MEPPQLSDEEAHAKATELYDWIEKAMIVGMRDEMLNYIANELKITFAEGCIAQLTALQRKL
jgi:hypothetical protein